MKKIKILMILDNLNKCDGIASYVMNYYKRINFNEFEIDFIISKTENGVNKEYVKLIEKNNGKIYYYNNISYKTMSSNIKKIKKFFEKADYDIVHCHILNMGYFYLKYARKNGIKTRILHSHTTYLWANNYLNRIRNFIFKVLTIQQANVFFACSNLAGKFLFKNKKFVLIKNAIEIDKYQYNSKIRNEVRRELEINENTILYGHIGRLNVQKNHRFLINIFEEVSKFNNSKLLLIGKGELQEDIKKYIEEKNLDSKIIMLGEREDIPRLIQAMDVFLLPSLFEGLPISGIEAQASGIKCLFSDTITEEIKLVDSAKQITIKDMNAWVNELLNINIERLDSSIVKNSMIKNGYDLAYEIINLENEYKKLIK